MATVPARLKIARGAASSRPSAALAGELYFCTDLKELHIYTGDSWLLLARDFAQLEAELSAKAPTNHASTAATYGAASGATYGHVRFPISNTTSAMALSAFPYQETASGNFNLNSYTSAGIWRLYSPGTSSSNFPPDWGTSTGATATLIVLPQYSTTATTQMIVKRITNEMWIRSQTASGTWTAWERFAYHTDLDGLQEQINNVKATADAAAPKSATLAGYGIKDAYTVVEVDGKLVAISSKLSEVEAVAKGASRAFVFDTLAALNSWLANANNTAGLQAGDNLLIRDLNVPDYWWDGTAKQELETQKVDLSNIYTMAQVDTLLTAKAPTSHASTATTYGLGTNANYGHLKLSDGTGTASGGMALAYNYISAAGVIDLNSYRTEGEWTLYNVTTATNFPTGTWTGSANTPHLKVMRHYSNTYVTQILNKRGSTETWIRYSTSATAWSAWERMATNADLAGREAAISAGTTAQYFRGDKTWQDFTASVRSAVLAGLSTATNAVVSATDSILTAVGKLQSQITAVKATAEAAVPNSRTVNGKALSANITLGASDVGLGNVQKIYTTGGSANAYTITDDSITLYDGLVLRVKIHTSNTSATVNINFNGTGNKRVYVYGATSVRAYQLYTNGVYEFAYSNNTWILLGGQITGSTSYVGPVSLTNSTSSTSTTTAATPASVKSAYDLATTAKETAEAAQAAASSGGEKTFDELITQPGNSTTIERTADGNTTTETIKAGSLNVAKRVSVRSGDTSTETETRYAANGTTVAWTLKVTTVRSGNKITVTTV